MHYGYYGSGVGVFGFLWHLIGIIVTVAIIVWVVRMIIWGGRGGRSMRMHKWQERWGAQSALSILSERYAKGEITKEEFDERKKTLLGQ